MSPAQRLAVTAHARQPHPGDEALDLRWSPDEARFSAPLLEHVWAGLLRCAPAELSERARHYAVRDPFGARRAAPVLSAHFGCRFTPEHVTVGAGTTGLLHALACLAAPGTVLHLAAHHPDLPLWARRLGARTVPPARSVEEAAVRAARHAPSLVLAERPAVDGTLCTAEAVGRLADVLARTGDGLLVVDESYACYGGPQASVAPLVARHPNLVVLRGVSKGYCAGGLRTGFALASPRATARLRDVAPPLAAGELGLHAALAMLAEGDVFAGLRARVAEVRPRFLRMLRAAGCTVPVPIPGEGNGSEAPWLPWTVVADDARTRTVLEHRRILGKEVCTVPPSPALLRLSVPLSDERERAVTEALTHRG
ncbi:aminotransferase class I/II-fold pyridoxal phosphate-dependent enzyme [Streptomyces sp. NPDC054796]